MNPTVNTHVSQPFDFLGPVLPFGESVLAHDSTLKLLNPLDYLSGTPRSNGR
jgi:hypothetical protein